MTVIIGQKEGLPNIAGSVGGSGFGNKSGAVSVTGAFVKTSEQAYNAVIDYNIGTWGFNFNASISNPIYGASSHVDP